MFNTDLDTSIDDLEQGIIACEMVITQLRTRQADAVRALDVHQVNRMDGARSIQEWVRARLDVSDGTARDLVHAARSLQHQPDLELAADEGRFSFDRIVATSKLVASGADDETVARSFGFDLGGVLRLRNRQRRITRQDEAEIFADRHVYTQDSLDGSRGRTLLDLPGFEHLIFNKALEGRADMFNDLPGPRVGKSQRLADAAVSIAQDALDGFSPTDDPAHRSDPLATVLVDASMADPTGGEAGAEIAYGSRVGPLTLERILCSGRVQIVGLENGKPVMYSNAARAIPPAIRKFVAWRDGGCVIDGCDSRYRIQPHHIKHRADHGDDAPDNLATLCWFHHHVVAHGMGLRLDPDSPPARRRFLRAYQPGPDPPDG
jgi:hypothetical protein